MDYANSEEWEAMCQIGLAKYPMVSPNNLVNSNFHVFEQIDSQLKAIKHSGEDFIETIARREFGEFYTRTKDEELAIINSHIATGLINEDYQLNYEMIKNIRLTCSLTIEEENRFVEMDLSTIDKDAEGYKDAVLRLTSFHDEDIDSDDLQGMHDQMVQYYEDIVLVGAVEGIETIAELEEFNKQFAWDAKLYSDIVIDGCKRRAEYFGW